MPQILIGIAIGAIVAVALLALYHPSFVRDTRRICHKCKQQIKRRHHYHMVKGHAEHYDCKAPLLLKEQAQTVDVLGKLLEVVPEEKTEPDLFEAEA